ncbi:unnamed protein product [Oppiella nova]|uniref:Uncharacterized protein n=1 Tax=Oppiella nova TaxID=334625 RepID=A0A7R9M6F1_9ACAR|nr:unnamed protein product [Oppiella nova]CAG2171639.1 unnamed protein product [Oppiella nova]
MFGSVWAIVEHRNQCSTQGIGRSTPGPVSDGETASVYAKGTFTTRINQDQDQDTTHKYKMFRSGKASGGRECIGHTKHSARVVRRVLSDHSVLTAAYEPIDKHSHQ